MLDRILLFPYYLTLKIRNRLYDNGVCKSRTTMVPTICIGNVAVGGTGKTPHTEAVLNILLNSKRWKERNIALLSRGYKRNTKGFFIVPEDGSASNFGDEPLMIKKKIPSVTVAVDRDRIEGCDKLSDADIIVLDDAFQYRKLKASLNIILTDYNRPHWKDKLMPFGRLRDLSQRLFDADIIVVTKCPCLEVEDKEKFVRKLSLINYNPKTCTAQTKNGSSILVIFTGIIYDKFKGITDKTDYRYAYSKKAIVFTGIAGDGALCRFLSCSYEIVGHIKFPDHHKFNSLDIHRIMALVRKNPTACVITTEKDAQRLLDCRNIPDNLKERLLSAPISVGFLSETERKVFINKVTGLKYRLRVRKHSRQRQQEQDK